MAYLSFDRNLLVDLEKSLKKEILRTNRSGAYNSTTIVDCNTRKYHGQLVVPLPDLDNENHVLLSSLDETVVQYGAEFNLGVHKYDHNHYSPNGHKYLRQFDFNIVSKSIVSPGAISPIATATPPAPKSLQTFIFRENSGFLKSR